MKIIGKTALGFIAELSSDEAAKIAGYRSSYGEDVCSKWREGTIIKIDTMYDDAIGALETLETAKNSLKSVGAACTKALSLTQAVKKP